jgi:hypothetical protein
MGLGKGGEVGRGCGNEGKSGKYGESDDGMAECRYVVKKGGDEQTAWFYWWTCKQLPYSSRT